MVNECGLILDGKSVALLWELRLRKEIEALQLRLMRPPGLAVVMVGDDPASAVYVKNKERACDRVGIASFGQKLPDDSSYEEVAAVIDALNEDRRVDGILVQLPLPRHLDGVSLLRRIDPAKDVDGLHPVNLGKLMRSELGLRSCTPAGVMCLLEHYGIDVAGKSAVVIGRSVLVGKPMGLLLLEANATVTIAHSRSSDLPAIARTADILVVAVGKPHLVTGDWVKPGAIVIDVGINRISHKGKSCLVGDVDFEAVAPICGGITPVPGGIGPMTVAMLLQNTVSSYRQMIP